MTVEADADIRDRSGTRPFRVALAQINPTVGDIAGNTRLIVQRIAHAVSMQADLVAFPELCITGYPPEDLLYKDSFIDAAERALHEIVEASAGICVVVGYPQRSAQTAAPPAIYNAAAVIHDGTLIDVYHKIFLPNYSVFDEERYFSSGDRCPVYEIGGARIGVNICEDIWMESGPTIVQREAGAQAIININGSPYFRGKRTIRTTMLRERASSNRVFLCYVNMVGGQDELVFDGASMILDPRGETLATAKQFEEDMLIADLPLAEADSAPRTADLDRADPLIARWARPTVKNITTTPKTEANRIFIPTTPQNSSTPPPESPPKEIYAALVLGTHDYVQKSGFSNVLIGLSGGIDSALTAAIAADALGPENVLALSMPSRFTADRSVTDARTLCENMGITFEVIPIEDMTRAYREGLARFFAGTEEGIAEENIQARVRGNLLMAISNKFGRIVLATGNKSEYATGYATLYGDMAGGFAVIKDVPKTLVYELCTWRNAKAGRDIIPQAIMDRPPTAELREDQLDEDSLPPYDLLDPVLEAYVERDCSPMEMVERMNFDKDIVERVVTLVDRSEYKRRQAAPGIKITERAFGKDRRLPIVNHYRPG